MNIVPKYKKVTLILVLGLFIMSQYAIVYAADLDMVGAVSYTIKDGYTYFSVDKIYNYDSGGHTGTLRLKLWATETPYNGGKIRGYIIGEYRFPDVLKGGYHYYDIVPKSQFKSPPDGIYYITLTLTEWDGAQDRIADYITFSERKRFGKDSVDYAFVDAVFDDIESIYSQWFTPTQKSQVYGDYYYRAYPNNAYLLEWNGDLWYLVDGEGPTKWGPINEWVFMGQKSYSAQQEPENNNTSSAMNLPSNIVELLNIINQERKQRGLSALTIANDLTKAAQIHSKDIGSRGICTHTGSDGSSPWDRVKRISGGLASGEIIACGHRSARAAVDSWMNSPMHANIMFNSSNTQFGAAEYNNYWTVVFRD